MSCECERDIDRQQERERCVCVCVSVYARVNLMKILKIGLLADVHSAVLSKPIEIKYDKKTSRMQIVHCLFKSHIRLGCDLKFEEIQ